MPKSQIQGKKTVGIRIPDYDPILSIVELLGYPLLTTSLPHDDLEVEEYTDPSLIMDRWGHAVDLILDGGFSGYVPSSVVEIVEDSFDILREGAGDCAEFN